MYTCIAYILKASRFHYDQFEMFFFFLVGCVMFEVFLFDSVDFSAVFCGPCSGALAYKSKNSI